MHTEYVGVREGLLSLLAEGPSHGFALKSRFEEATGGVWPLNVGQVYTTLDRLHRDGLVEIGHDDGQKTYRLTSLGSDELDAWWQDGPTAEPPPRDELLLKVLLAIPHGRDHALDVLGRQRAALVARLQAAGSDSGEGRDRPHETERLVGDAVLLRTEADLRWLDRCEERLLRAEAEQEAPSSITRAGRNPSRRRRFRR
jgi:DNA-binding PadR family transcriptional regulator